MSRVWMAILCFSATSFIRAEPLSGPAAFLGAQSCSSASCHGGAGNNKHQYTVWTKSDFHHNRPYATLQTPRAERLAQILKIGDPAQSPACTVCHAPFQTVPKARLADAAQIAEGVSCESCHGPAQNWLRSHTRSDWTHADRVRAGMHDLRNPYVRANVCIACHQTLAPEVRAAGHPELIFELDGQAVSQPKHWRTQDDKPGPQLWLIGQAAALRELSWQLSRDQSASNDLPDRWAALTWLLQRAVQIDPDLPPLPVKPDDLTPEHAGAIHRWSDQLAKQAAQLKWSEAHSRKGMALLADTADSFLNETIPAPVRARRAERLVLALDRFSAGIGEGKTSSAIDSLLDQLFKDAESLPDFQPKQFAKDLQQFHASVAGMLGQK